MTDHKTLEQLKSAWDTAIVAKDAADAAYEAARDAAWAAEDAYEDALEAQENTDD